MDVLGGRPRAGAVKRQRRVRIYEIVWVLALGFVIGRKRTLASLRRRCERATGQTIDGGASGDAPHPAPGRSEAAKAGGRS